MVVGRLISRMVREMVRQRGSSEEDSLESWACAVCMWKS